MRRPTSQFIARTLLLLSAPTLAWALPEDAQQPIQITADNARFDEKSGEALFRSFRARCV